jgi:branched-chain amino acid transport system permease protein
LKAIFHQGRSWGRQGVFLSSTLAAMSLVVPFITSSAYILHVLIIAFVYVIGAAGFRLMYMVGRVSLGQSVFIAVGGYTSALLTLILRLDPWLGMLAGGITALLLSLLIGLVALKSTGIYFAIITLALVELAGHVIAGSEIAGGHVGLMGIPGFSIPIPFAGNYSFGINKVPYYYLIVLITGTFMAILYGLEGSRIGRVFKAIRSNDDLAQHMGINPLHYRLLAFGLGAFFSGLSGGFSAHYLKYLGPGQFGVMSAIMIQVYAVTGGLGSFSGPLVGTLMISGLLESLRLAREWQPMIYGAILVIIVVALPGGLASFPQILLNRGGQKR